MNAISFIEELQDVVAVKVIVVCRQCAHQWQIKVAPEDFEDIDNHLMRLCQKCGFPGYLDGGNHGHSGG